MINFWKPFTVILFNKTASHKEHVSGDTIVRGLPEDMFHFYVAGKEKYILLDYKTVLLARKIHWAKE